MICLLQVKEDWLTTKEEGSKEEDRLIIIMYIYHALINALSAHVVHINLNMVFYTHVEHSPTKTIYIKYYTKTKTKCTTHVCTHTCTLTHARTLALTQHTHTHTQHTHSHAHSSFVVCWPFTWRRQIIKSACVSLFPCFSLFWWVVS